MKLLNLLVFCWMSLVCCVAGELKRHDSDAISKAMESDRKAAPQAAQDPQRPAYHFLPVANWMNDPNGPILYKGYYHMFYQHNPYGAGWGNMHWGHARSRDLVHWEHLPVALWPSKEAGEDHVFSGCSAIRADGKPVILYTSIGRGKSATDYAEQWLAVGSEDLIRWEKEGGNPALAPSVHGERKIWDWRDPFLFKYKGEEYLVLGGNLNHGKGGEAVVNLYKSKDTSLMKWEYLGVLFTHPDPKVVNIECPNFFELDDKWVLIVSPHRRVEYFIGTFDGRKFISEKSGLLDHSDNFYAPNSTADEKGRRLLWGWIRGFPEGKGWNGCLTLPREVSLKNGDLWQRPVVETQKLRRKEIFSGKEVRLIDPKTLDADSAQVEISAAIYSGNNSGIRIKKEGTPGLEIFYSNGELKVGEKKTSIALHPVDPLLLHVFIDHSVVEVFANGGVCLTKVFENPSKSMRIEIFSTEKNSLASISAYELSEGSE